MKLANRIKTWWKTTTTTEKVLIVLDGIATTALAATSIISIRTRDCIKDTKVEVKLCPKGADDPNPISLENVDFSKQVPSPYDDGRYDPYETARDLYKLLDRPEEADDVKDKALQLAWDLAAREGLLEKAEGEIPYQVYD